MPSLHHGRPLAVSAIVVGVLLLLVGALTGGLLQVLLGVLLGTLGVFMVLNPMVVFEDGEAQVRSPLGFTVRRFPISGPADLRVEGNKLVHVPTGKKVSSLGFGVRKTEVEQLRAIVPGGAGHP